MRSITIRTLMAFVVVTAVGLAAMRNANGLWAGCVFLVTLGVLLTAMLRTVHTSGASRAGWLGFSLFGFVYLAVTFTPLVPSYVAQILPTSQWLDYVHAQVELLQEESGMMSMSQVMVTVEHDVLASGSTRFSDVATSVSKPVPSNPWRNLLPGAADRGSFVCIGHCVFALLAGLIGATIARGSERRRSAAGTDSAS